MSSLKPCPFCGGEAKWVEDTGGFDVFGLVVDHDAECFLALDVNRTDFDVAWNTRAPLPVTDEMVERAIQLFVEAQPYTDESVIGIYERGHLRGVMDYAKAIRKIDCAALTAALGGGK